MAEQHTTHHKSITLDRSKRDQAQSEPQPPAAKQHTVPRGAKLELFLQMAQQGMSVLKALKASGIVDNQQQSFYDPSDPSAEIEIEELFYKRCALKLDPADASRGVITDKDYNDLDPARRVEFNQRGYLSTSSLYRLIDWLYFVRGLPIKAIASALQLEPLVVAKIKAELSNDFAKTIRMQSAEGYIADLLRTKELLRADINYRKSQLNPSHHQHAILNKLLWELENRFVDRLQEIGIIDKHLGKMDVHEEWHVSIDPVGAPVNEKVKEIPAHLSATGDPDIDVESTQDSVLQKSATPKSTELSDDSTTSGTLTPEQLLGMAGLPQSATIPVGQPKK